jgi:hypothetical protein
MAAIRNPFMIESASQPQTFINQDKFSEFGKNFCMATAGNVKHIYGFGPEILSANLVDPYESTIENFFNCFDAYSESGDTRKDRE